MIGELEEEARALQKQLIQISFYMRGGMTIEQAYQISPNQRVDALSMIEDNIKRSHESGLVMF
jgi:hypothetical protein